MLLHWFNSFLKNQLKFLLRDELQVHIQSDHIALLRIRHGLRGEQTLVRRQVVEITKAFTAHEPLRLNHASPETWAALGQSLGNTLQLPIWHKTKPVFIVANHWVRYALLPWNTEINSAAERSAYLTHCFKNVFGEPVQGWHLAASTQHFEKTSIASAIPTALLQTIEALSIQSRSFKISAIYPALKVINQALLSLHKTKALSDFWLVMVEKSRVCVCLIEHGDWQLVRNMPREPDVSAQVSATISREIALREAVHQGELSPEKYPIALDCQLAADTQSFAVVGHHIIPIKPAWPVNNHHQAEKWAAT